MRGRSPQDVNPIGPPNGGECGVCTHEMLRTAYRVRGRGYRPNQGFHPRRHLRRISTGWCRTPATCLPNAVSSNTDVKKSEGRTFSGDPSGNSENAADHPSMPCEDGARYPRAPLGTKGLAISNCCNGRRPSSAEWTGKECCGSCRWSGGAVSPREGRHAENSDPLLDVVLGLERRVSESRSRFNEGGAGPGEGEGIRSPAVSIA